MVCRIAVESMRSLLLGCSGRREWPAVERDQEVGSGPGDRGDRLLAELGAGLIGGVRDTGARLPDAWVADRDAVDLAADRQRARLAVRWEALVQVWQIRANRHDAACLEVPGVPRPGERQPGQRLL